VEGSIAPGEDLCRSRQAPETWSVKHRTKMLHIELSAARRLLVELRALDPDEAAPTGGDVHASAEDVKARARFTSFEQILAEPATDPPPPARRPWRNGALNAATSLFRRGRSLCRPASVPPDDARCM